MFFIIVHFGGNRKCHNSRSKNLLCFVYKLQRIKKEHIIMDEEEAELLVQNLAGEELASVVESENKVDLDQTGLSDSEDELEIYDPMPYAFILKDVHRNQLVISPDKLHNAKISCPSFHTLLDHVVAVLWCFYSKNGHHKLGTSQLHWAIKFLEGLCDSKNRCTPDVFMAIEDLEEALVEVAASVDETRVLNRTYDDQEKPKSPWDFTTQIARDMSGSYDSFQAGLLKSKQGRQFFEEEDALELSFMKDIKKGDFNATHIFISTSEHVESPSIIINDMIGGEQDVMVELLQATMREMNEDDRLAVTTNKSALIQASDTAITDNYVSLRVNELIDKTIKELEQIKNGNITCPKSPADISQLKDMLKIEE